MALEQRDRNVRCWARTAEFESLCLRLGLRDVARALE